MDSENSALLSPRDQQTAEASKKRLQFLASCIDSFMQDFLTTAKANDKLGCIVAAAKLAQMGVILEVEYTASANALVDSSTERKVAIQAAEQVLNLVNANAEACKALMDGKPLELGTSTVQRDKASN